MADTDSPLAQVDHLLQQREQYEQWLARLDGTGSKAPDAVRQKVRSDYQARLDSVLVELRSHASAVEVALAGHKESLGSLEARQADIQERLAEAEIRHSVGEYTDDEWGAVGAEAEAALEEIGRRIGAEQGEITRLSAVLHLVAKPAAPPAPAPSLRVPTPMPEPAAAEPEAPPARVGGTAVRAEDARCDASRGRDDAAAGQAGSTGGRAGIPQVGDGGAEHAEGAAQEDGQRPDAGDRHRPGPAGRGGGQRQRGCGTGGAPGFDGEREDAQVRGVRDAQPADGVVLRAVRGGAGGVVGESSVGSRQVDRSRQPARMKGPRVMRGALCFLPTPDD